MVTKREDPRRGTRRTSQAPEESVWEKLAEISARIPREELAKAPTDVAKNVDHYLYGSPKVEE